MGELNELNFGAEIFHQQQQQQQSGAKLSRDEFHYRVGDEEKSDPSRARSDAK